MIKELESLGRLLDKVTEEHNTLPNEFTSGKVEGVSAAYALLAGLITNDATEPEESIPFSTPTGPMTKYGVPQEHFEALESMGREEILSRTQEDSEELGELQEIKGVLQDIYNLLQAQVNEVTEDAQKLFTAQQETQILEDVAEEAKSAGLDVAEGEEAQEELSRNPLGRFDTSFGQRMMGHTESQGTLKYTPEQVQAAKKAMQTHEEGHKNFQLDEFIRREKEQKELDQKAEKRIAELRGQSNPSSFSLERAAQIQEEQSGGRKRLPGFEVDPAAEAMNTYETTYDPDTGAQGRQRRIGMKFNPEEDAPKKTTEQWEKMGNKLVPKVYTADSNDELQDLGPGQV